MSTGAQRARILIVEDDRVVAAELQASLKRLGYKVAGTTGSGAEALELAQGCSPDVVLMDVGLAGSMDGVAAAAEIRRKWSIPVVFVTGIEDEQTLLRASATGPYGFVLKPFRTSDLNAAILVALEQHRLTRELFSERTWLRTTLESLSDGVIATDGEGRLRYMNPAGEGLVGCKLDEVLGRPIEEVYHLTTTSNEPLEMYTIRRALLTRSSVAPNRFLLHSKDGRVIPVEASASPVQSSGQIMGAVAVYVDISERLRKEQELELEREALEEQVHLTAQELGETRAELRALSGHLITMQEEERRRVARELHDDLGQRAALAALELERILPLASSQDGSIDQAIQTVRERLAELSTGLRDVSHRLHPSMVEDLGLTAALRALVNDYCESGGEVSFGGRDISPGLPLAVSTALYRIAQEALRNAFKHAGGAPARVTLEETNGELRLKIEDAGPGFDLTQVRGKGGLGLLSMHERTRLIGGNLLLRSRPGDGTLVLVRLPLNGKSQTSAPESSSPS